MIEERPPIPPEAMQLDPMTPAEVMALPLEELNQVEHETWKWQCCAKDCTRFTRLKEYGIWPWFFWRKEWIDVEANIFFCGYHWKIYRRGIDQPGKNIRMVDDVEKTVYCSPENIPGFRKSE
jgi:hypothetical protein